MTSIPRFLLACLLSALLFSCASKRAPGTIQEPHAFDEQGAHVFTHARGSCTACDLYRKVRGFVVLLDTAVCIQAGVVFTADGEVVTNAQVVGKARSVEVVSYKLKSWVGTVVARDEDQDLAIVSIPKLGHTWAPPALHDGPPPPVGTDVFLIGHPVGLGWCITRGIITGSKRFHGVSMIETDAAYLPGNSGGALVDANGRLIGVVSSRHSDEGTIVSALARPTAAVLAFIEEHQQETGAATGPQRR
jgi:S1-C subfamily serine protease